MQEFDNIPFGPGGGWSGVPGQGGHAPSGFDAMQAQMREAMANRRRQQILAEDNRARFVTGLIATGLNTNGQAAAEWIRSNEGQLTNLAVSGLINSQLMSKYTGGSVLDMSYGMAEAMARAGMSIDVIGGMRNQSVTGRGALSDTFGHLAFQQIQDSMFSNVTGAAHLSRTQGFNRSEIGEIAAMLGSRGALQISGSSAWNEQTQSFDHRFDDGVLQKMESQITETAKMLRSVKNVMGNKPIQELAQVAEDLAGMSIGEAGAPGVLRSRIEEATARAERYGLNVQATLQFEQRSAQLGQHMGLGRRTSAVFGGGLQDDVQASHFGNRTEATDMSGRGMYVRQPTQAERHALGMQGQAAIAMENPEVVAAAYLADRSNLLSQEQKDEYRRLLNNYSQAASPDEQREARAALIRFAGSEAGGGRDLRADSEAFGGVSNMMETMTRQGLSSLQRTLTGSDRSRTTRNMHQLLSKQKIGEAFGMGRDEVNDVADIMLAQMDTSSRVKVLEALREGDVKTAESLMRDAQGLGDGEERERKIQRILEVHRRTGGQLDEFVDEARVSLKNNKMFDNYISLGDQAVDEQRRAEALFNRTAYGADGVAQTGIIEAFTQGMLGGTNMEGSDLVAYGKYKGWGVEDGFIELQGGKEGFQATEKQAAALMRQMPGLAAELGVGNKPEEVAKALNSRKGYLALMKHAQQTGTASGSFTKPGEKETDPEVIAGHTFLTTEASQKAEEAGAKEAEAKVYASLTGMTEEEYKEQFGTIEGLSKEDLKERTEKLSTALRDNMDNVLSDLDDKDKSEETLKMIKAADKETGGQYAEGIKAKIKEREKQMEWGAEDMKMGWTGPLGIIGDAAKKALWDNRKLSADNDRDKKLLQELGSNNAGDYVMTVKMILEDGVIGAIHKSRKEDSSYA